MALLVGLLILIALAAFAVENWSPAVPLVILGTQTTALPMALWVIGALLAGALTVLAIAALLQLISSPNGPRPPRGDRYGDEDRQRYVVDPPPDDRGPSRWANRANPYVDEVRAVDVQDDYGEESLGQDEVYRSFADRGKSTDSMPQSDSWDSFVQPRQDWGDWETEPRRSQFSQGDRSQRPREQGYRSEQYRDEGYRNSQVLEVTPIDVRPVTENDRDRQDGGDEAGWNDWNGYEEPAPPSTPTINRPRGYDPSPLSVSPAKLTGLLLFNMRSPGTRSPGTKSRGTRSRSTRSRSTRSRSTRQRTRKGSAQAMALNPPMSRPTNPLALATRIVVLAAIAPAMIVLLTIPSAKLTPITKTTSSTWAARRKSTSSP